MATADILRSIFATVESGAIRTASQAPIVATNRARLADVVAAGYSWLDWWNENKTTIFVASTATTLLLLFLAYKRRKIPEAVYAYLSNAALSCSVAWLSRPTQITGTTAQETPTLSNRAEIPASILSRLDADVSAKTQERPTWEQETWSRLLTDLGLADNSALVGILGAK